MSDLLNHIKARVSCGRLQAPAPTKAQLLELLSLAQSAPDHGYLRPWYFKVYAGESRQALGKMMCEAALEDEPALIQEKQQRLLENPLRAPVVVVACAKIQQHPKVPEVEQILATGAACQNILLGVQAMGYAVVWRTGLLTYRQSLIRRICNNRDDKIVGFLYLGTASTELKDRQPRAVS